MLAAREVTLCLMGHAGDLIARLPHAMDPGSGLGMSAAVSASASASTPSDVRFVLNEDSAKRLLVPGDRSAIRVLLPLASAVDTVTVFADSRSSALQTASLYQTALAEALNTEVDAFRAVLLEVEPRMAAPDGLSLTALKAKVSPFVPVFTALARLVVRVDVEALRGGALLDDLYRGAQTGAPSLRDCFRRLFHRVAQVMFNQLSAWLLYGMIQDVSQEFFVTGSAIQHAGSSSGSIVSWASPTASSHAGSPSKAPSAFGLSVPASTVGGGVGEAGAGSGRAVDARSGGDGDGDGDDDANIDKEAAEREWRFRFTLDERMLPSGFIPKPVGEAIVMVGKSVRLLRQQGASRDGESFLREEDVSFLQDGMALLRSKQCPSSLDVEVAIDRMRAVVAARLWTLIVDEARLMDHLKALNDYFLLGRGEFIQAYADNDRLGVPEPFRTAAVATGVDKDPHFRLFDLYEASREFEYPEKPLSDPPIPIMDPAATTFWHPHPVVVAQGFSTSVSTTVDIRSAIAAGVFARGMDLTEELERPPAGFSFVLHTEGRHAAGCGATFGEHDAVGNCLVIRFKLEGTTYKPVARVAVLAGKRVPGGGGCALRDLTCLGTGSRTLSVADDGAVAFSIEYTRPAAVGRRGRLSVTSSGVLDATQAPALTLDVTLGDVFPLRGVRGRCWVGVAPHTTAPAGCTGVLRRWSFASTSKADDGEDSLGLAFRVPWPLHLVITQAHLDSYNELFKFMLRVRRVSIALNDCWATLMSFNTGTEAWHALKPVWLLRSRMAFVVTNLQAYLQQDVVDSAFERLRAAVLDSRDFAVVSRAHSTYIQFLVTRSFLRQPVVSNAVSEILMACTAFVTLVDSHADDPMQCVAGEDGGAPLARIDKAFKSHTNFLFETQRAKRSVGVDSSLMLRMDFNGFF